MNKPFFKIVDYIQSSDARQDTTQPPRVEPEFIQPQTHTNYRQSLTPSSKSGDVALSTFEGPTLGTIQSAEILWDDLTLSALQLTRKTDFKSMGQPRQRTKFTVQQLTVLLNFYEHCQYIKIDEVITLADKTGLTIKQVKHWFKNRRAASKRINSSIDKN